MSEELLQTVPLQIGKYTYYRLGSTTLNQLRNNGIIPKKNYRNVRTKKPDGLVVYHGSVKAVVEYKQPKELKTDRNITKAITQEIKVAKSLCKILILTDGSKSFWINALNGERIRDANSNEITTVFHPFVAKNVVMLEYLLGEVDASISATNSIIQSPKFIDPTPLANRLWQTIWVATGKSPIKCLYNVVELFIFKFLSDLRVLDDDIAFAKIYKKSQENAEASLEFYARNTRKKIYKLFPTGTDGTTIINGTIFVAENGEPNLSQALLFRRSLNHLHKYTEEFGNLTKIDKQFKTKLYESFLKQEVKALGQYLTPRKVIQSIIRMGCLDSPSFQFSGKRICDPFCGVGGFPLELLNMNESMMACYAPDKNCSISLPFVIHGFDKGFERDDERTIIMAKANMLIYLAELLFVHPQCSKEFARIFNDTFYLFKDNLGTFGHIIKEENEKYDIILSNPPYVTKGSSIIKEEIQNTPHTAQEYPVNALGLESLAIEWVVKSLRHGGKAYIIVPDGVLGRANGKLRRHILKECYLEGIVSLPDRTFFANAEHTYILVITKKHNSDDVQVDPVFTYLVSNIGERLTSVKREEIEEDDLPEMERLFRIFSADKRGAKKLIEKQSDRCKVWNIKRFQNGAQWVVDRWWTKEERIAIGDEDKVEEANKSEVDGLVTEFKHLLADYDRYISADILDEIPVKKVALSDESLFRIFIGNRVLKKDVTSDESLVPVYSANVFQPMGYFDGGNITDFEHPSILWGIDGNFEFNLIPSDQRFATTDHCGTIQILDPTVLPEYILYALIHRRIEESFDRGFRASLSNMRSFVIKIPIKKNGMFDVSHQKTVAARFSGAEERRSKLENAKFRLDTVFGRYLGTFHL